LNIKGLNSEFILNKADVAWWILQLSLALQILKNIENHIIEEFDIKIRHNIFGWLFFSTFYINFKIKEVSLNLSYFLSLKS